MIPECYLAKLTAFESEGRLRKLPPHRVGEVRYDLSANDYMGMGARWNEWMPEFRERFGEVPMTASASRLLASDQLWHNRLEEYLAREYGKQALLFNSGYHANVGLVTALNLPGTVWVVDKLIHASVIDGLRMAGADFLRWNHNDTRHLRKVMEKAERNAERVVVVCESVYSMDGDIAPIAEIAAMKKDYPSMLLYVDEAHAIGACGPKGLGICAQLGLTDEVDILVGTLGKACASSGAFVVVEPEMKQYLVNTARSLIFSTAIPPANAGWSLFMLEKLAALKKEREHLAEISERFRKGIEEITGMANPSESAIVPLQVGDAAKSVAISERLLESGVLALPIRRPTVPPGGERIRFSLNASLEADDIDWILDRIREIYSSGI